MRRIKTILSIAALPILMASCGTKQEAVKTPDTNIIPVKVMSLETGNSMSTIAVSGQFTTDDEVFLSFKTAGIINKIYVREGDVIKKGQLLATLNMAEINAQVEQAKIGTEKAQRDYHRVMNLYKDSVATLEQTQNAKTGLDIARQQLAAAEFNRNFSEIRATSDGYVLRKIASEGQWIGVGSAVFQTNGAKAGSWMLRVGVSDKEWAAIQLNDKADIAIASQTGRTYEGKVSRKSEGADPATGSFTIDIKVNGTKPGVIAAGMFGKAIITPAKSTSVAGNVWSIPYDALLDGDGSAGYVFITNDGKTATKIKVTVDKIEKDKVIISDGLQNVQSLIISGSAYLTDSSLIKIIQ